MQMRLGKAKQNFSKAIKAVKGGKDVILTERGKPIAAIKPFEQETNAHAAIRRLEAEGILRRGPKCGKPMPVWRFPVRTKGNLISDTIREERDER